ncbi:MAG TPA: PhzF family phenazine biosynthesis protein [Solirubrobacteraceae bacterium]
MRRYVVADVFTDVPLEGNPVAVFADGQGLSTERMQRTARELNLSETVFLLPGEDGADACVRIFTPMVEMPFAGHPVLGTAFVLGERLGAETVRLKTGAGIVSVALRRRDGAVVFGEMEQPLPTWELFDRPDELLAAIGAPGSTLPIEVYDNGPRHVLVACDDEAAVIGLRPDLGALEKVGQVGVSCFAIADGYVKARLFGPGLGVAEDPATGSAAGPLAVHLARHGRTAYGDRIEIHQGAEIGRPSILHACAEGSAERLQRVTVGGGAVIVAQGEYRLD